MSAASFRHISVFEPHLRALGSHHFEYVQLLRGAAPRAGLALRTFCDRDASPEVRLQTGAEPLFAEPAPWQNRVVAAWPRRFVSSARSWLLTWLGNRRAARELNRAFGELDWDGQLILVPNCNQDTAAAWGRCLREPLRRHPGAAAVLVFPFLPGRHLFLRSFRALLPLVHAGRVALATDSEPLAALYRQLTGLTFTVLPMPYGTATADGGETPVPTTRHGGGTRFLACGNHRMEKGIDLLADLIVTLEGPITAGAMSFTLQGFAYDTAPDPEAARHFARIKSGGGALPAGEHYHHRVGVEHGGIPPSVRRVRRGHPALPAWGLRYPHFRRPDGMPRARQTCHRHRRHVAGPTGGNPAGRSGFSRRGRGGARTGRPATERRIAPVRGGRDGGAGRLAGIS